MGKAQGRDKSKKKKIGRKAPAGFILQTSPQTLEMLDKFSASSIQAFKRVYEKLLRYHWAYYSELEFQRRTLFTQLQNALNQNTIRNITFERWCRLTKVKWNNTPLSAQGSLKDPGGRFNIGDIDANRFPTFPALYIAENQETSLQETLGQHPDPKTGLTLYDNALSNRTSYSIFMVSGMIETVFDLRDPGKLSDFCNIIKGFSLSDALIKQCKGLHPNLKIPLPKTIKTTRELLGTLLDPNWRVAPFNFDIPSNPQIFGQIVHAAGIEGIIYPSKMTGKHCLAVFPENFNNSSSYVKCDDPLAETVLIKELNAQTWKDCV